MKKLRWILLTLGLFLPLTACGTGTPDAPAAQSQTELRSSCRKKKIRA